MSDKPVLEFITLKFHDERIMLKVEEDSKNVIDLVDNLQEIGHRSVPLRLRLRLDVPIMYFKREEMTMPKPLLREPYKTLCMDIIETLIAGHKRYRYDLPYPKSHSDMQGAVEGLLMMFEVKRRHIAIPIESLREKETVG